MIHIESRRRQPETLEKKYPAMEILDVTSRAEFPWVKFSPFFPHGDIPIPFSGEVSQSVEGLWQALKVFEQADIDMEKTRVTNMRGIKRTVRKYGRVIGHRKGTNSEQLLGYLDARKLIYIPTYNWVLKNCLNAEVVQIRDKAKSGVVLLDYETNGNIHDLRKPLSHAWLVKYFIENGDLENITWTEV